MKLYLFGGAEIDIPSRSVSILKKLIKDSLLQINPKSILHVPFARPQPFPEDKGEWDEGWFKDLFLNTAIKIHDARNQQEIDESFSVIFINGGPERKGLLEKIKNNSKLYKLIQKAKYIVAESSGSMVLGEFIRTSKYDSTMLKSLGILKDTVIEPHYTERNYKRFLPEDMQKTGVKYGLGIDSATGILVNPSEFPKKWKKIGTGNIFVKTT